MNTGKLSNTGFRSTSGEVISSIERMARQAYDRLDGNVGSLVMGLNVDTGEHLLVCMATRKTVLKGHSEGYTNRFRDILESFNN
jgi:hypothetical protein